MRNNTVEPYTWLGPLLTTFRYVTHFRFCHWARIEHNVVFRRSLSGDVKTTRPLLIQCLVEFVGGQVCYRRLRCYRYSDCLCSAAVDGGKLMSYFNLPWFAWGSAEMSLVDKVEYDTRVRVTSPYDRLATAIIKLFVHYNVRSNDPCSCSGESPSQKMLDGHA